MRNNETEHLNSLPADESTIGLDIIHHAHGQPLPDEMPKHPERHKRQQPEPEPWTVAEDQNQKQRPPSRPVDDGSPLPVLYLPSDIVTSRDSAMALMEELGKTRTVFSKNGQVVRLHDEEGVDYSLSPLTGKELPSFSQKFFRFQRKDWKKGGEEIVDLPRQFTTANASAILGCVDALSLLPKISKVLFFPPIDSLGNVLESGYHHEHELLVTSKVPIPKMPVDKAVSLIKGLFIDNRWETPADQSRAIASILAPMLRFAVNLKTSLIMPLFMVEADLSQTGKGHLIKIISEIYGEPVTLIAQRKRGVGSLDESFNRALLDGRRLISFDNLRGKMDSTVLEAFVTASGKFSVRALRVDGAVDSRDFVLYATSNQFEVTPDLANRICVIRIRRQPEDYQWKKWKEGSLLEHVKANHALYLGAVAAVMGAWAMDGQPQLDCPHPQREWASSMNWILQRIFGLPPLMETHADSRREKDTSLSGFLTDLGNSLPGQGGSLTVGDMISHAESAKIRLPVNTRGNQAKGSQLQLGALLSQAFGDRNTLEVNGYTIDRSPIRLPRPDGNGYFDSRTYRFRKTDVATTATTATTATAG